ncbi:MAG: ATP-binding protein [Bacteroidaceae bacterium]|nr:ATP-binding protein [Bacteroidaceae bacterium]
MEKKENEAIDLLMAFEQIVEMAEDSQLSDAFYRKADKYIKYVSAKLDLSQKQSVMLALFVNRSYEVEIQMEELSKYVKCSTVRILRYMNDIDELEKKEFIRCRRSKGKISYRVPLEFLEAVKRNEKYLPKKYTGLSCQELFGVLEEIFKLREDSEITYDIMVENIESLFKDNPKLEYVSRVENYELDYYLGEESKMLLVLFSHLLVNNDDNYIRFHDLDFLYDYKMYWYRVKSLLSKGTHPLFDLGLIEHNNDDGMVDRESFRMTDKAKTELFSELCLQSNARDKINKDIVRSDKIAEKKLFYGESIQSQINELSQLLDESHYKAIHCRMKESGFRCGFTCLFYGSPGTGKTETVLQLARQTGRDIIQVNVADIKSCWVGESEKNIKNLFDTYREHVKKDAITPILLFNEADALINKRLEGAQSAVNKMENSILNIILQEMENLDGILIATTNLAQNMDTAFERRFLYKIKFERPTFDARVNIWRTIIPTLNEEDSRYLANKYDFSGGQIENIARHYTIGKILHGESKDIRKELSEYCNNERLESHDKRNIGFF